jgi:hypothetical protein
VQPGRAPSSQSASALRDLAFIKNRHFHELDAVNVDST